MKKNNKKCSNKALKKVSQRKKLNDKNKKNMMLIRITQKGEDLLRDAFQESEVKDMENGGFYFLEIGKFKNDFGGIVGAISFSKLCLTIPDINIDSEGQEYKIVKPDDIECILKCTPSESERKQIECSLEEWLKSGLMRHSEEGCYHITQKGLTMVRKISFGNALERKL